MAFKEISIDTLKINPFHKISKEWMLITAGDEKKSNTMTASWGGVGIMWGKNVATAYIRPQRYTKEFVDNSEYFTCLLYTSCVAISTTAALHEMLVPGVMAVLSPLAVGLLLGPSALGGLLAGALVTGVMMAIFMSNAGGAWDNAKKYIEDGNHGCLLYTSRCV